MKSPDVPGRLWRSIAVSDAGKYYNRLYFVKSDGRCDYYDKRHLFTYGGEDGGYTRGRERAVVEWKGVRILFQVCYDLRFPVFSRNRGDYDMIIYCANWPQRRIAVWDTLLRARAVENSCYVVGVNRVGSDPYDTYAGRSAVVDYRCGTVASAGEKEAVVRATVDMEALREFRKEFPVLEDSDDFTLNL